MSEFDVVLVEDSFAKLAELEDEAFDVTITDPPYNEHVHGNMISGTAMKKHVASGKGAVPKLDLPFDPLSSYAFAKDLVRVSKRWALSFCAVEDFGAYRDVVGKDCYPRSAVWIKPNAQGQMTGDRPAAAYEGIAVMHRQGKKVWNGRGSYGYWIAEDDEDLLFVTNGTRGEKGRHPNQKPLKLCLELVAKFTNPGETVFDPFAGSARIGEACVLLGRSYVGWDKDPYWVEEANRRLELAAQQPKLLDEDCLRLCALPRKGVAA